MNHDALIRLRAGLEKHFGTKAVVFVDPVLWLCGYICVDIVRLDNWFMQRHADYSPGESMCGFIRRKYGRSAEKFVGYWLRGESSAQVGEHKTKGEL